MEQKFYHNFTILNVRTSFQLPNVIFINGLKMAYFYLLHLHNRSFSNLFPQKASFFYVMLPVIAYLSDSSLPCISSAFSVPLWLIAFALANRQPPTANC